MSEAATTSNHGQTPDTVGWHLFRIDAHDQDGLWVYLVSAESASASKAQELAEAAVLDDAGTAEAPAGLDLVTALGRSDSDIFEKIGPL